MPGQGLRSRTIVKEDLYQRKNIKGGGMKKGAPYCGITGWARWVEEVNQQLEQKPRLRGEAENVKDKTNDRRREGLTFVVQRGFSPSISGYLLC